MDNMLESRINQLIDKYMEDLKGGKDIDKIGPFDRPDRDKIIDIINALERIVFPGFFRIRSYKYYTVRYDLSISLEDRI